MNDQEREGTVMSEIIWNDELKVGIMEIDEQHHNLVKILNSLYALRDKDKLSKKATRKITYTLLSFAKYHFSVEEILMMAYGYDDYNAHKDQHDAVIKKLADIHSKVDMGHKIDYYPIFKLLNEWFHNHTRKFDVKYVPFFINMGVAKEVSNEKNSESKDWTDHSVGSVSLIDWEASYDLGIEEIDSQHMNLVNAINGLYSTIENPDVEQIVKEAFSELDKFVLQHFSREEKLLEKMNYPTLAEHHEDHEEFKKMVRLVKSEYSKHNTVVDHDLVVMLKDWFFNHAQKEDRKYIEFFKRNKPKF